VGSLLDACVLAGFTEQLYVAHMATDGWSRQSQYDTSAARAFVLRHDGVLRGYINRCAHVPVEMDWQPGEFLDSDKRFIVCSIHGASYEPAQGRCVGGSTTVNWTSCFRTPEPTLRHWGERSARSALSNATTPTHCQRSIE
jgi:nitrite reductase/ring-hydroxylating ferredoxin subunit